MRERGRKWYKERGKWIIESRIKFPDQMLMTLDISHCRNAKFLKKMTGKMREKSREKLVFPSFGF